MDKARRERDGKGNRRIWILSFEASDVVYIGGLGQAVSTLAHALSRLGNQVTVFMPSHGRQRSPELIKKTSLGEYPGFLASGSRRGVDNKDYPYSVGFVTGYVGKVRYMLAVGMDEVSSRWLDHEQVYNHDLTFEKMAFFARAMKHFMDFSILQDDDLPDIIHMNDWHTVPAGTIAKQRAELKSKSIPLVFTIHLLSFRGLPWHYLSEDWCGLEDIPTKFVLEGRRVSTTPKKLWEERCQGSFERFGSAYSDWVTTVSRSYLHEDLIPFIGRDVEGKAGYIYNGCDWNERDIVNEAAQRYGLTGAEISRNALRSYLLTSVLERSGKPINQEKEVDQVLSNFWGGDLFLESGAVRSFDTDRRLVLMTGRLSRQKGVDILIEAIPEVLRRLPDTNFLLMLSAGQEVDTLRWILTECSKYAENVRVVVGALPSIYRLAHAASDVFAMPSRWEPFGIAALEAMSTGNPVVASKVGGLKEIILDLREEPERGTGLLVERENIRELADGIVSVMMMVEAGDSGSEHVLEGMPEPKLARVVLENQNLCSQIRDNCRRRVDECFRPVNSAKMAIEAYSNAELILAHDRQ
jgi:starch synthase